MENLRHNSKVGHRAYDRRAQEQLPSLSDCKRQRELPAGCVLAA